MPRQGRCIRQCAFIGSNARVEYGSRRAREGHAPGTHPLLREARQLRHGRRHQGIHPDRHAGAWLRSRAPGPTAFRSYRKPRLPDRGGDQRRVPRRRSRDSDGLRLPRGHRNRQEDTRIAGSQARPASGLWWDRARGPDMRGPRGHADHADGQSRQSQEGETHRSRRPNLQRR